jgi:hypothetical protein
MAAAAAAGAREESLPELGKLLIGAISRDADLEPVVMGDDGKPVTVQGKPLSVEAFVRQYLEQHKHHQKPVGGAGGGASGGASYRGTGPTMTTDQARARIVEEGDRSAAAVNALFEASRKTRAS